MPCDNVPSVGDPLICDPGGGGYFLPLGGEAEQLWDPGLRAFLYFAGLLWCFVGVAIIADVFMSAIEKVTSKKVLVYDKTIKKRRTKTVWNGTVANLTLMALGSSAPEIMLNVIGIFPTFLSNELGPGTIVGSAAFNLLIILAVCVVSIPGEDARKIKDMGVFSITAFFSVFAYLWLLFILLGSSKDIVEVWEGALTFAFFFVLVLLAFLADIGKLPGTTMEPSPLVVFAESSKSELAEMEYAVRAKYGRSSQAVLTPEQVTTLIDYEYFQGHSRATHRCNATRSLVASKRLFSSTAESNFLKGARLSKALKSSTTLHDLKTVNLPLPEVSFKALNYTVLESVGKVEISVKCLGEPRQPFKVHYSTRDGTATAEDYLPVEGDLTFGPNKLDDSIFVEIYQSSEWEKTEQFYVDLEDPRDKGVYCLGSCQTVTVVIIDEDFPGKIAFGEEVKEIQGSDDVVVLQCEVKRRRGCSGKVTCRYATESDTAIEGSDFDRAEGILEFEAGQENHCIDLTILPKGRYEGTEKFRLILSEPTGGAVFDETTDGGREMAVQTIIIHADTECGSRVDKLKHQYALNWDVVHLGNKNWKDQFVRAFYCLGSPEDQKDAEASDWVAHSIALPWKLLFACVSPTEYMGGWLCFCMALGMIGLVTCIISDMAELLGCVLGIRPYITAITFVACGTSLPDTFASRTAAQMELHADNSIGNVTGSNSVNVFLGLGLPWMISSLYWTFLAGCTPGDKWSTEFPFAAEFAPSGVFVVQAGSLAGTVITFCCCAVTCISVLLLRRYCIGGELGGDPTWAWLSALFMSSLWIVYIVVSILLGDE